MKLGILGGTFNPIHHGHLWLAQEALEAYGLDQVWLMPNRLAPHRQDAVASAHHRYVMACLAAATRPEFVASNLELERPEVSYTVDTVAAVRDRFPQARLYFLTGADAVLNYPWKDFDRLLGMLDRFVAATRPGFDLEALRQDMQERKLTHGDRVAYLAMPAMEISSSDIRRRVGQGRPIRYLLPRAVEDYLVKHRLYLDT